MMHDRHRPGRGSTTGRRARWRLARLVTALAIMLVAVLPHATLAASALHRGAAPFGVPPGAHHDLKAGAETLPCHEAGKPAHEAMPAMPACCILGCGLLASAPDIGSLTAVAAWRTEPAATARPGEGAMIEPAERPPRPRPQGS